MIPYGRQSISEEDIDAVVAVLRGDWLTQGPDGRRVRGTSVRDHRRRPRGGLHKRHRGAPRSRRGQPASGPGTVVGTSSLTFSASAACARYVGARSDTARHRPDTLNVDPASVPEGLDALVAVHYAGLPMDLGSPRESPSGRDRGRRPRPRRADPGRARRELRPQRHVLPVVPPRQADHHRRGRRGDHQRRLRSRRSCDGSATTASSGCPSRAAGTTRSTSSATTTASPTCRPRSASASSASSTSFIERRNTIADRYRSALSGLPRRRSRPARPRGWRHGYHLFRDSCGRSSAGLRRPPRRGNRRAGPLRPAASTTRLRGPRLHPEGPSRRRTRPTSG